MPTSPTKCQPAQRCATRSSEVPAGPAERTPLLRIAREGSRGVVRAKCQPAPQSASRPSEVRRGVRVHGRVLYVAFPRRCAGFEAARVPIVGDSGPWLPMTAGRPCWLTISQSAPLPLCRGLRRNIEKQSSGRIFRDCRPAHEVLRMSATRSQWIMKCSRL